MTSEQKNSVLSLPIWKNKVSIEVIKGGMTNQNFLVNDGPNQYFVRLGKDIPEHLIFRQNEISVSKAASLAGLSPKFVHSEEGITVFEYIQSTTYNADLIIKNLDKIIEVIKKIHTTIPQYLEGQPPLFWVFHVIQHYANFLKINNSSYSNLLEDFHKKSMHMNKLASPYDIVFCHNDFLAANFIENESQIWVVDWEYAGFNTPLFDLGGLVSNNEFTYEQEIYLLENYYDKKIDDEQISKYLAIKCASLLRETMWSMVSEITSKIDFDYKDYTHQNLSKFNDEFKKLKS
tara:strand:+ start:194 stop:1063 length:870 start_codon:yes stop_codon:yes gene_type:complete